MNQPLLIANEATSNFPIRFTAVSSSSGANIAEFGVGGSNDPHALPPYGRFSAMFENWLYEDADDQPQMLANVLHDLERFRESYRSQPD